MQALIAILYGFVIWLSTVAYAIIAAQDLAGLAACMMPVTAWPSAIKSSKGRKLQAETATATASRCHGAGR